MAFTLGSEPRPQLNAFQAAGYERVYTEKAFGAQRDRPELKAAPRAVA
jgi:DNA invertase Pin-like site-specific DNA recombinase